MKRLRIVALLTIIIIGGLILIGSRLYRTVTLVVDGNSQTVQTFALTTSQLLRQAQVSISPDDQLSPGAGDWLGNNSIVTLERAVPITIYDGENTYRLNTPERIPANLFEAAQVELFPDDQVFADGVLVSPEQKLPFSSGHFLSIRRSVTVNLQEGTEKKSFQSTAATLGEALWQAGYRLYESDILEPSPDTPLVGPEMQATLTRSQELTVQIGQREINVRTKADTIGEAMAENGLAPQQMDYVLPGESAKISSNQQARLVRVEEEILIEQTPVPFKTDYQPASNVELDSQKVISNGEYGLTATRVRVRLEDGKEISRQKEDQWTAKEPKNRVVGFGTNVVMHSLDTPDGTIYYWRALTMWITSYSDAVGSTTASGQKVRKGLVGVNPHYIPYGTKMYVPGYGMAEAADTGNIGPRWIDLGYTQDEYVAWHQYSTVYFLWPPPANIIYQYPR